MASYISKLPKEGSEGEGRGPNVRRLTLHRHSTSDNRGGRMQGGRGSVGRTTGAQGSSHACSRGTRSAVRAQRRDCEWAGPRR